EGRVRARGVRSVLPALHPRQEAHPRAPRGVPGGARCPLRPPRLPRRAPRRGLGADAPDGRADSLGAGRRVALTFLDPPPPFMFAAIGELRRLGATCTETGGPRTVEGGSGDW